jgi:hypothetical protein
MTRFASRILCAALGVGLLACGSNGSDGATGGAKDILEVFPRGGDVSGWTIDPNSSKTKDVVAKTATDQLATEALIDGASADFFKSPFTPVVFGVQNYLNTTLASAPEDGSGVKVKLYVLQMPTAAQASSLYSSLLTASLYLPWTPSGGQTGDSAWADPSSPVVGDHSRVADAGDTWWINFYKGVYYGEIWLTPSYGPKSSDYAPHDASLRKAAFDFATAVAAKM